jgi:hypothetical protein
MNNDQAVSVFNDVAYTYSCEKDTPSNRQECIDELRKVGDMGDHYVTTAVESGIKKIEEGVDYLSVLKDLVTLSEEMLDEMSEGW